MKLLRPLAALLLLLFTSCQAMLTPAQRQQLETRIYPSSLESAFSSARDVMINQGFEIRTSDFAGGVLEIATLRKKFSAGRTTAACFVSLVLPPVGDAIVERDVVVILFDAFTYPFSIFWSPWFNLSHGLSSMETVRGNITFEKLGKQETRVRISLTGVRWDVANYPRDIRRLQDLVDRQLLLKRADRVGQDTVGQGKAAQEMVGPGKAAQEKGGQGKAAPDKVDQGKGGQGKAAPDKAGPPKTPRA